MWDFCEMMNTLRPDLQELILYIYIVSILREQNTVLNWVKITRSTPATGLYDCVTLILYIWLLMTAL